MLISEEVYCGDTRKFNERLNEALAQIETEEGFVKEKRYNCKSKPNNSNYLWHSVLIFYDVIPTRKVLIEKTER